MIFLLDRALIRVGLRDAQKFLQSQFTNDITQLKDNRIQVNAYCQHQGKVIAIIWVYKENNDYFLSIPSQLKDIVISKLNMFKMISEVDFQDLSDVLLQYGFLDEVETPPNTSVYSINSNLSLLVTDKLIKKTGNKTYWELECIKNALPEVCLQNSEKLTPQSLNLDKKEFGVSFSKGCYPGQEVVARMHYLGKPKRRLFLFTSKFEVLIGDSLNVNESKSLKSSGEVIRSAKNDTEFYFLGVFEVGHINEKIFLNNDENKLVSIIHE